MLLFSKNEPVERPICPINIIDIFLANKSFTWGILRAETGSVGSAARIGQKSDARTRDGPHLGKLPGWTAAPTGSRQSFYKGMYNLFFL